METVGQTRTSSASDELRSLVATELERILASEYFRTSKQAERLLRYLVAHSLEEQEEQLRERVIGEKVFGRPPKYDSNSDSIVRVWANHLRKRLSQYYAAEAHSSGIRFGMHPGSYRVEFHPVVAEHVPVAVAAPIITGTTEASAETVAQKPRRRQPVVWILGLAVILAFVCGWLAWQNVQLRARPAVAGLQPPLGLLWSRMFSGQQPTEIVFADSSLSLFQDLLRRPVSLQDYIRHNYLLMPGDSPNKHALEVLMTRRYTSTADIDILRRTLPIAGMENAHMDAIFARDFSPNDLKQRNVILVGSKRSNPWAEPFEQQMNFRFEYDDTRNVGRLVNVHPQAGEPQSFTAERPVDEMTESFGLVAFLPNLEKTGNVLMISGLGMQGTLAGGELVTDPELFQRVVNLFGLKPGGSLPYFEAVLKSEMMGSTVHGFKIVAWRRVK